ncbi:trypco2 family protein [Kitasatospora sp. NPDC056327]|uniref:trypco2 family protein n=1 Tax=Kitasatospora sp. NPDC056327 TaxID=3345785 RepID=UPI0035D8CBA2
MIELSDVIRDLRGQLEKAMVEAGDKSLVFDLGVVELDVTLAVERSAKAGGKVRFLVAELGGEATLGHSDTQHIKLTLHPRVTATGRSPEVSGESLLGER